MKWELIEHRSNIIIPKKGYYTFEIGADTQITIENGSKVYLHVFLINHAKVEWLFEENANATIIVFNEAKQNIEVEQTFNVHRNATVYYGFSELSKQDSTFKFYTNLLEEGAHFESISSYIAKQSVTREIVNECKHIARNTYAKIQSFGVAMDKSQIYMMTNGHILKHASGSQTHQLSKILTYGEQTKAKIDPNLLIDENDVSASHAASIGQLDEAQLYYLQSRGISLDGAMNLIIMGYIFSIFELIDDESVKQDLQEKIESVV